MKCSSCGHQLPDGAAFCPACATPVDFSSTPTVTRVDSPAARGVRGLKEEHADHQIGATPSPPRGEPGPRHTPVSHTSDFGYEARYVPGATLLERYRIVSPLGKGGMGEVYRTEDLKLGQTVALKFLPKSLARNEEALGRFTREVRMARQVSHPNVCRVFDIGEADGQTFLTMEFVDGEDMSSLMRRIGRLPADKALEIARQVCAGLAAAHEHGIIHRDLKPANIMLDGRGRARITDFGLAGLATEMRGEDARAGTPAYMSPEQFSGGEVTPKSDLYSLGLVMYEIFTGKKAHEAATYDEMARLREKSAPTAPSAYVKDIDPLVERVMLRCLEKNPDKRPASALQVAAALPGGDPLAAALAAGDTPSPEMVAASGEKNGLRPAIAWACLALIVAGMFLIVVLSGKTRLLNLIPMPDSPEVLVAKSRDLARELGYTAAPTDSASGFTWSDGYLDYVRAGGHGAEGLDLSTGVPPLLRFWYRESPQFMMRGSLVPNFGLWMDEPPNSISGMYVIVLDGQGRLVKFEAIPPQVDPPIEATEAPNWGVLFAAARLDQNQFKITQPQWTPLALADARAAWEGTWPGHPELPLRVEAAAYRGKPMYFDLISPWTKPDRVQEEQKSMSGSIGTIMLIAIFFAVILLGMLMARNNLRAGRGDRHGATKLALLVFLVMFVETFSVTHHIPTPSEFTNFLTEIAWGLIFATFSWVIYVALEPHVRSRWPTSLISWSRLLAGQLRDPDVGRDVLVGILTGVFLEVALNTSYLVPGWTGKAVLPSDSSTGVEILMGIRYQAGGILLSIAVFVAVSLVWFFIFFIFRLVLRKEWLAALAMILLFSLHQAFGAHPALDTVVDVIYWSLVLVLLIRFGILALMAALCTEQLLHEFPLTPHLSAWYAESTILLIFIILAGAIFGFCTSTKGKPLFGGISLDA